MTQNLFVGIDVAFAKGKRLPVCLLRKTGDELEIVPLRKFFRPPPLGKGNVAALDENVRERYAAEVGEWICDLQSHVGGKIKRVAIDAPSYYAARDQSRRAAERAMDKMGISVFATPTKNKFKEITMKARRHIAEGGAAARLPHANQIWMLIGFELFKVLRSEFECIEVYPQAIVRELGLGKHYKTTSEGHSEQVAALARRMNASVDGLHRQLFEIGYGSRHDKLDALMSAWVASLDEENRVALGNPPEDVIWVPRT